MKSKWATRVRLLAENVCECSQAKPFANHYKYLIIIVFSASFHNKWSSFASESSHHTCYQVANWKDKGAFDQTLNAVKMEMLKC